MVIQPLIGNPYSGYVNPYYWVDDHPLLYGNNGSLDPGTYKPYSSWVFMAYNSQESLENVTFLGHKGE